MEKSLKKAIEQATSILVLLPTRPYFDQVAAGLSLFLSIRKEKEVSISSPSPMTVEFNRLVGVSKISGELGNKNLLIKFADYKASDVERVSYDIEDSEFRLTVIPKPGVSAPTKDQAILTYSGVSGDTVILVGGINESHFPALSSNDLTGAKIVHIGTRGISLGERDVISLAKPASSTSEVTATLIKESGMHMGADIATNLLLGIEEGSNKFTSNDVSADTFQLVSELMRSGGQRALRHKIQRQSFPPGAIPGQFNKRVVKKDENQKTPKDWLEPKIYKGTSTS